MAGPVHLDVTAAALRGGPMPWHEVSVADWERAAIAAADGAVTLLGLWAHGERVLMALWNAETRRAGILALTGRRTDFPSVGRLHAPAQRLERAIRDLHGLVPTDAPDARPWLDHGRWLPRRADAGRDAQDYAFLPAEGESLHRIPVGPVHAGIIEPGHFRFTAQGETVVRLEARLGYVHKGIEALMGGAGLAQGSQLAGRTSGDSTVAYAWAFAQAAEAALRAAVPPRALCLRALMAEMERLANHLGDIGAICNDAAFPMILAECSVLRERVLRAAEAAFGHRLMRDRIVPGGVAADLAEGAADEIRGLVAGIEDRFRRIMDLYDRAASLLDRTVGTGCLSPDHARRFGAGGYVGRASGRDFDTRRDVPYAPYDRLRFEVPLRRDGDVHARVLIRADEIRQSLGLIGQVLAGLPEGPLLADLPAPGGACEGIGLVEGFRGDVLVWLALDAGGRIDRCHLRDPSWFQWPLLEAAIEGNIVADFPLCNKSFNCSYSGHDL